MLGPPPPSLLAPRAPIVPPSAQGKLELTLEEADELREHHRLDLELYSAVQAAFQLQLLAAKRTHGDEVLDLLGAARNGTLPGCPQGGAS